MGDPPPILLYCSWIFGVRRLAMNGANLLKHSKGTRIKTLTQSTTPFPKSLLQWVFRRNLPKLQHTSTAWLVSCFIPLPFPALLGDRKPQFAIIIET